MRILIDIGHPAHVHYFRNFIKIMEKKGHHFFVIAKDRNVTFNLLDSYNIKYVKRKNFPKSLIGKLINIPITDLLVIYYAIKFKPSLLMGFSGTHIAHAGMLLNIPSIVIDDTEHASLAHASYKSFASHILTPNAFQKDFGKKQIRFNGYMELCYLHPNYFNPDSSILDILNVKKDEKYVILRFVSWNASHDLGQTGLSLEMKYIVVNELSKYAKVFISSEGELPDDLKQYQIKIPPARMHDALAFAALFLGEGATMASECACLGTPAIYINSLELGYCTEEEIEYNLIYGFRNSNSVLEKAIELLNIPNLKGKFQRFRLKMLADKIDVTAFLIWFVENYPKSVKLMKDKPSETQKEFK